MGNDLIVCDSNNHSLKIVDLTTKSIKNIDLVFSVAKRLLKETDTKIEREIFFEKGGKMLGMLGIIRRSTVGGQREVEFAAILSYIARGAFTMECGWRSGNIK